jgi:hypothetical protein
MTWDTPAGWRASRAPFAAFVALLFALLTALAPSQAQRRDDLAMEAREVLAAASVAGHFRLLESNPQGHTLGLVDGQGVVLGTMRALRRPNEWLTRLHSRRFTIAIANSAPDPTIIERLVRAGNAVVAADGGPTGPAAARMRAEHQPELIRVVLIVVALAALAGVVRRGKIVTEIRLPHIPAPSRRDRYQRKRRRR